MSAACVSVLFNFRGRASESCCCSCASQAVEQSFLALFQRPIKVSSNGRKRLIMCRKPFMTGRSAESSSRFGSSIVACNVSGLCLCKAYALSVMNNNQYSLRFMIPSTESPFR